MEFRGKTAIVTGGARGIGKAVVQALGKQGANIVVADLDMSIGKNLERDIRSMGCDCLLFEINVTHKQEINEMVKKTVNKFHRIDMLFNCAGIVSASLIIDTEEEDWNTIIEVNLKGVFLCCQAVAKEMIKQRAGKIINISSMAGKTGPSLEGAYAASKSAVITFTKTLAKELAPHGINVNAVCPGFIETEMAEKVFKEMAVLQKVPVQRLKKHHISFIPLGRMGKPEEVANLVLFLASEKASYITGESVNISGGR